MTRSQPMDEAPAANDVNPADGPLYSRFLQRLHRRYADVLPLLPPGEPNRDSLSAAYAALQAGAWTPAPPCACCDSSP